MPPDSTVEGLVRPRSEARDVISKQTTCRIGVDLGGTKIEIVALAADGAERIRRRVPTPSGDYDATIAAIAALVDDVERELGERCPVGIGTPGAIDPATGLMKNANSTCLIGRPFAADVRRSLGRDAAVANDADCLALSEAVDGAGTGAAIVLAVILGTGVGGGIVVRGEVLAGPNAIAGEWGHNPLPWPTEREVPGRECYCGKRGCIETWLSGPAFARDAGFESAFETIAAEARGDARAREAIDRYVDRLARGLATLVNVVDPHVVVFGGGVSNAPRLVERARERLRAYAFSPSLATRFARAAHGDSSGVRGAARLRAPEARSRERYA